MGVEPTRRRVEVAGVGVNRVESGRISASRTVSDALAGGRFLTPDRPHAVAEASAGYARRPLWYVCL